MNGIAPAACLKKMITMWSPQTLALEISIVKPSKQLMIACSMSRPRLSGALMVDSIMSGLHGQGMFILTTSPPFPHPDINLMNKQKIRISVGVIQIVTVV
jgi:hypothetical protein